MRSFATPTGILEGQLLTSRWVGRGIWAIMDQALFATSNFALGILLARWLGPDEFGAFAIAQAAFLLFGMLHIAVLIEPMLVFGTSRYADRFSDYLRQLLRAHWVLTGGGTVIFGLAAAGFWMRGSSTLSYALTGAALATPPMLLVWMARRACFACFRPHYAAAAGAMYLILMLVGVSVLFYSATLSPFSAFLVLGGSSLLVGAALIRRLQASTPSAGRLNVRALVMEHWQYGRWALASTTISWVTGNIYFFILPFFGGLAATAALRALANLVVPMLQAIAALSTLLLPLLVRSRGTTQFRSILLIALLGFVGAAAFYWVLLGAFADPLVHLMFGGKYREHAHLLWLLGILPVLAGIVAVLSSILRAYERPDLIFWAYLASGCTTLSVGLWAVTQWEIAGAAVGQILAALVTASALAVLLRRSWWNSSFAVRYVKGPPEPPSVAISTAPAG
jgi:O-antigen/teichoic acid export membrane protein